MTRITTLPPDRYLYDRLGPWPQPSPSHPLIEAPSVLNIPAMETMLWNGTIGARYLTTQLGQPPLAAYYAVSNQRYLGPSDADFNRIMFETAYTRFLRPLEDDDRERFGDILDAPSDARRMKYDFRAMELVEPLAGLYCAPTWVLIYEALDTGARTVAAITVGKVTVTPGDPAWTMAKAFALQGAAYHMLFVVHPALHFPMDSVNAITKTAIPMIHPIFQLLYPHTQYSLALDNAVLTSDASVVNNNAAGTWYDPLTGDGYNLKLLFGAGYAGLPQYGNSYPRYDYMSPQKGDIGGLTSPYLQALERYYQPFEKFARIVARQILSTPAQKAAVGPWARYVNSYIHGFPDPKSVVDDADRLGTTLAIYMWDVSVSHGADHYSFGTQVAVRDKMLRIRIPPPTDRNTPPPNPSRGEVIASPDDLYRASVCQQMFFLPYVIQPSLANLGYPLLDPASFQASLTFQAELRAVDEFLRTQCPSGGAEEACCFQPLLPRASYPKPIGDPNYTQGPFDPTLDQLVLPATIQY